MQWLHMEMPNIHIEITYDGKVCVEIVKFSLDFSHRFCYSLH